MAGLPAQITHKIKNLCALGYQHYDRQNYKAALRIFYQAWLYAPKPQTTWIEAGWILTAIGDTYYRLAQFEQAHEALNSALHCPGVKGNPFVHMRLGQSYYEQNDIPNARLELHRAFQAGGTKIFETEPPYYLDAIKDLLVE